MDAWWGEWIQLKDPVNILYETRCLKHRASRDLSFAESLALILNLTGDIVLAFDQFEKNRIWIVLQLGLKTESNLTDSLKGLLVRFSKMNLSEVFCSLVNTFPMILY